MQQVAVPSLYAPRHPSVQTTPFPLVRRPRRDKSRRFGARRFVAGLLFGVFMSMTLALLGYAARVYVDQNPGVWREAIDAAKAFTQ